jgi:hypothetical protein
LIEPVEDWMSVACEYNKGHFLSFSLRVFI